MWGCARNRCRCAGAGREWSEDSRAVGRRQSGARWHRSSTRYWYRGSRRVCWRSGTGRGNHRVEAHRLDPFHAWRGAQALGSTCVERIVGVGRPPSGRSSAGIEPNRREASSCSPTSNGGHRTRCCCPIDCRICSIAPNASAPDKLGPSPRTCALDRGKLGCAANEVRAVVKHDPAFAAPIPVVPAFDPARLSRRSRRNEQVGA